MTDLAPTRAQSVHTGGCRATSSACAKHTPGQGRREITVAVLDTGVDVDQPELKAAPRPGFDFVDIVDGAGVFFEDFLQADANPSDPVGHGTHLAGIIVGEGSGMRSA